MMTRHRRTIATLALSLPLAAGLAACGSDSTSAGDTSTSSMGSSSSSMSSSDSMSSDSSSSSTMADGPFGPACSAVPSSGSGSFDGMANDPVATAASNNPVLSQLVGAVKKAGLVDTLNSADGITVFAPTDDAFKAVPKSTLTKAMNNPKGLLTTVLTNHVVKGRISPDELAGDHTTLAGTTITVTGSGEDFSVGNAKVVCGNVQTANATVYIIDGVLLPKS